MTYKVYPAYRESGIGWLGQVPKHWGVERVRWAAKLESGHTPAKSVDEYWDDGDLPWVSLNDTRYLKEHDHIDDTAWHITSLGLANSSARKLPAQAVVFTRDASIGFCAITTRPMAVSQHIIAWICGPQLLPEYLLRVFYSMTQELERLTMGATVKTIGMPDVSQLVSPIPPKDEQRAIVEFVERKTRHIDDLIAKKQLLIELLNEKRAAIISHAVTKGLDPNVPMKDSGIEWLGEIPKHWEVRRNRALFSLFPGYAFKSEFFSREDTSAPKLVTPGNFDPKGQGLYFHEDNSVHYSAAYPPEFKLSLGDLLIVMTDLSYKKLILGLCAKVDQEKLLLNQRIAKLIFHRQVCECIHRDFLFYSLCSDPVREQVLATARGSTVFHSSPSKILDCHLAMPPYEEQARIIDYLCLETSKISRTIKKIEMSVQNLSEYRTALISAAVTGKIDVRNHVPATTKTELERIMEESD